MALSLIPSLASLKRVRRIWSFTWGLLGPWYQDLLSEQWTGPRSPPWADLARFSWGQGQEGLHFIFFSAHQAFHMRKSKIILWGVLNTPQKFLQVICLNLVSLPEKWQRGLTCWHRGPSADVFPRPSEISADRLGGFAQDSWMRCGFSWLHLL